LIEIDGMELVGTVVSGDRRGRTLGFPTANVEVRAPAIVPPRGVYAALADGQPAAVNVGLRPTFYGQAGSLLIEVHILDFEGDRYGHEMRVTFLQQIRRERRFDDVSALTAQLERDVSRVRELTHRSDRSVIATSTVPA
jgi:riboflavin kinase/FMN adenylyltransferase